MAPTTAVYTHTAFSTYQYLSLCVVLPPHNKKNHQGSGKCVQLFPQRTGLMFVTCSNNSFPSEFEQPFLLGYIRWLYLSLKKPVDGCATPKFPFLRSYAAYMEMVGKLLAALSVQYWAGKK